jgi:hypothetical protein
MALTSSKLSGWLCREETRADERPVDERDVRAIELAKRDADDVLDAARIVDAWCDEAVGVECIGAEILLSCSSTSSASRTLDIWLRESSSPSESSKAGTEGREGMSLSSMASIRRQMREGVSNIPVIVARWQRGRRWVEP